MSSESSPTHLSFINLDSINVIDYSISKSKYVPIDLSVTNTDLKHVNPDCYESWNVYIANYLKINNAEVAFGGYLEKRNLYKRSPYFNDTANGNQRNIHLGVDLWAKAGTSVLAAFDGEIHSFNNNSNHGDYGPTIILKHNIYGVIMHTLYGHLSIDSLHNIKVGDKVKQGEVIAQIGTPDVNGEYVPHLHFQIVKDLQGKIGDYPGVSNDKDLVFFKDNCPNPNILLNLDVNKTVKKNVLEKELNH